MYCQRTNVPLQLDHVVPRSKGGSVWPSNFVSACEQCNQEKGGQPLEVYLQDRPALLAQIQAHVKAPLAGAAAVGSSTPERLSVQHVHPLFIQATGWQRRQMCLMNAAGFPRTKAKQPSRVKGFRTGDLVRAVVPSGKKVGCYEGRVAVRASGSFNITTQHETVQGIKRTLLPHPAPPGWLYLC